MYLAVGLLAGPFGLKLLAPALQEDAHRIEAIAETVVVVSLFCVGLRLRAPLQWCSWSTPVRLATLTMLATIALVASAASVFFDLSFAEALLLGAILAPTDPVLASDMHMPPSNEHDTARFSLAAEGSINTGLGIPAVTFALGLLGLNDVQPPGVAWIAVDVVWAIAGGLAFGWLVGALAIRGVTRLELGRKPDFFEDFLILGAGAAAYVGALAISANAFVSVLAAGVAVSHGGRLRRAAALRRPEARYVGLAQRLERIAAVVIVLLVGAMLAEVEVRAEMFLFALLALGIIRPIAVRLGLGALQVPAEERRLIGWFGVRGAASVYFLVSAVDHGMSAPLARELTAITLVALVTSIVLHGLSATPLASGPLDRRA